MTESTKKIRIKFNFLMTALLVVIVCSVVVCPCASGASMWSMTYGGTGDEAGTGETIQTIDGGYAVSGDINSSGAGGFDFWLFKTDADGNMEWNQTYGGALDEVCGDMCQTNDGGYAIAGGTYSFGAGGQDFYLVKTDTSGNMEWNQTYGGTSDEWPTSVLQTLDGGYSMFGFTESFGAGLYDLYLVKTDADGNMEWNMTYGGTGNENDGYSHVQLSEGGYALLGSTESFGAGDFDFWLVRTGADGNMEWNMTYGGTGYDGGYDIVQVDDGGYTMTGLTMSFGGVKTYLVKADANGSMEWNMTYGTPEMGLHLIQASDEGYAIAGWSFLNGEDLLLIKTDASGNMEWSQTYGGTGFENGYAVLEASDGGYVLTGTTGSFGAGGTDVWLLKTDELGVIPEGFTTLSVILLSSVAVTVSFVILRKQPKSRLLSKKL